MQKRAEECSGTGADVMILKIFSPKYFAKILAFFAQSTTSFCKHVIITLVFEKSAIFVAENWQKSPKIAIITSTPDLERFEANPSLGFYADLLKTIKTDGLVCAVDERKKCLKCVRR
jgi:hypothetical protein